MKKLALCFSICLLVLLLFAASRANADAIVSVSAPASVSLGDSIVVHVDISNAADLYALQLDLSFEPTILSAVSVSEGTLLPDGGVTFFLPGSIDNGTGVISANADTLIGSTPGVTGDGTLLGIQFLVIGTGTSDITPSNIFLLNSNLDGLNASATGASVISSSSVATPEPSTALLLLSGFLALFIVGCKRFPV